MKNLLLAATALIMLASCGKRINVNGDVKNRRNMLMAKQWIISEITENDGPFKLKECQRDNYFIFNDDGSGTWEEGANNCLDTIPPSTNTMKSTENGPAPTSTSFTWSCTSDQREIYIYNFGKAGQHYAWDIAEMNYSMLKFTFTVKDANEHIYDYNVTMVPRN